jgi:hypothetical protein
MRKQDLQPMAIYGTMETAIFASLSTITQIDAIREMVDVVFSCVDRWTVDGRTYSWSPYA